MSSKESSTYDRIRAEMDAIHRTTRPTQNRQGGILVRELYARLKRLATQRWGDSQPFPRSLDHATRDEVIDFLNAHIALHHRATAEGFGEYTRTYSNWIDLSQGRLPLRMRRELGSEYRSCVLLRSLEIEWGALGGHGLEPATVFEEMDIARCDHPTASTWDELLMLDIGKTSR